MIIAFLLFSRLAFTQTIPLKDSGIYEAVQRHDLPRLRHLLARGEKPDQTDLLLAIRKGDPAAMEALLVVKADPNGYAPDGTTMLNSASGPHRVKIIQLLLRYGADANACDHTRSLVEPTPLQSAIISADLPVVKLLLSHGANPNFPKDDRDSYGRPLLIAPLLSKVSALEIVQRLVEAKADVNYRDFIGQTPLMSAVKARNLDVVKYLVQHGATVNARTDVWRQQLETIVFTGRSKEEEAKREAMRHGNHYATFHQDGLSALDQATTPEIRDYLIRKGGKNFARKAHESYSEFLRSMSDKNPS